ncbi:HU family DNA-binding protein [candidate division WWE3 bacterium]|uniref:HU family DNA-binding protein n=1 Tax=candidate division WWE3 bacterium TaxID=2053526 RepID=A0A955RP02_UNCKA|nr:HU family DNA-binding protein [candidate division WWE3 bacterium]MCA9397624.1 HU family DNA-binding protein [candidate division WWE3 bacterium]
MTKSELIEELAQRSDLTKRAAGDALNAMLDIITESLAKGDKVTLTGFGTFLVRQRAARMGRNPQTGDPLHIPAQTTPAFRAGSALKESVR